MKTQKGITLIALIITIIVLLILAGVSISMVVGDNGILEQTGIAKDETQKELEKEQVELAYTAAKTRKEVLDEKGEIEFFLQEELNKFEEDKYIVVSKNEEIKVQSTDSKNIYTIKNDIVTPNSGKPKVSLISQITEKDYGDYVNYSADLGIATAKKELSDGSVPKTDWRIFYKDTNNVYLIASDYLPVSKFPSEVFGANNGKYNAYWKENYGNTITFSTSGTITTNKNFLFEGISKVSTSYNSYKAVATLLDTGKWSVFAKTGYVDDVNTSVIGSPTLEMWLASWNGKYTDTLEFYASGEGYYFRSPENSNSLINSLSSTLMQTKEGFSDTLYYPHASSSRTSWNSCYGYWLAAPGTYPTSNRLPGTCLARVNCHGTVGELGYNTETVLKNGYSVRPVVALKSGITAVKDIDDVWQLGE